VAVANQGTSTVALKYNKECILYLEPSRSGMNYDERESAKEAITKNTLTVTSLFKLSFISIKKEHAP